MASRGSPSSIDSPAANAAAVTPSDVTVFAPATRGLYIGATGDVAVNMLTTVAAILFKAVPAGTILPIAVTAVKATGTTATQIIALW